MNLYTTTKIETPVEATVAVEVINFNLEASNQQEQLILNNLSAGLARAYEFQEVMEDAEKAEIVSFIETIGMTEIMEFANATNPKRSRELEKAWEAKAKVAKHAWVLADAIYATKKNIK